jgi:hypothetical protein
VWLSRDTIDGLSSIARERNQALVVTAAELIREGVERELQRRQRRRTRKAVTAGVAA